MWSALRRDRSRDSGEGGCEPTVFINQVSAYLQRAAQERQTRGAFDTATTEEPIADAAPVAVETPQPSAAPAAAVSELSEWIDIDQVMAAIAEPPAPPRQPARKQPAPNKSDAAVPARAAQEPVRATREYVSSTPATLATAEPVDNEQWSYFDPHKHGFPALIAKLNAIANVDDAIG